MIVDLAHVIGVLMQPRHVERRRVLFLVRVGPGKALGLGEERVPLHVCSALASEPLLRIAVQQSLEQRVRVAVEVRGKMQLLLLHSSRDLLRVLVVERVVACEHLPAQQPNRPPVHHAPVHLAHQLLGRHVQHRPHPGVGPDVLVVLSRDLRRAKVGHDQVPVRVEQHVFGLEVAVHDPSGVQPLDRKHQLGHVEPHFLLHEGSVFVEQLEQVPAVVPVHEQVQPPVVVERTVQPDDEGMLDALEDGALVVGALYIELFDDQVLAHGLERHDAARLLLSHLIDLAKAPFPDQPQQLKVLKLGVLDHPVLRNLQTEGPERRRRPRRRLALRRSIPCNDRGHCMECALRVCGQRLLRLSQAQAQVGCSLQILHAVPAQNRGVDRLVRGRH
mmetsp:Transcript_19673/g.46797  ORF Transcript_19673/g.46797 Transcript_19673/m.46797 type:complete len:388 (-) Transcript_19673:448-1611(-)